MKKVIRDRGVYRYVAFLVAVLAILVVFIALPHTQGSINGSAFWNSLTGAATSETTTLSVVINSAPKIVFVSPVHRQTITEGSTTNIINITFNVTDGDGFGDINNKSGQIRINLTTSINSSTAVDRFNTSCVNITPFTYGGDSGMSFNCSITIWYFDGPGNWTINVSANDTAGVYVENRTGSSMEVLATTAMAMNPNALTWATLELGRTNQTSNNDPVIINNTGNKNINVGGVTVTAYNLQGATTTTDFINAGNFSLYPVNGTGGGGPLECNGTMMINGTNSTTTSISTAISVANITRGNNSNNDETGASGQEQLYFCLRLIPTEVSRQTYNTGGGHTAAWTVAVS